MYWSASTETWPSSSASLNLLESRSVRVMIVEDGTAIAQCFRRVPERLTARSRAAPIAPASRHSLSTTAPSGNGSTANDSTR